MALECATPVKELPLGELLERYICIFQHTEYDNIQPLIAQSPFQTAKISEYCNWDDYITSYISSFQYHLSNDGDLSVTVELCFSYSISNQFYQRNDLSNFIESFFNKSSVMCNISKISNGYILAEIKIPIRGIMV
tara:strand:- start:9024 stop:9428 length:405 start_codon:yes stop_codon:yes gene_type:complete